MSIGMAPNAITAAMQMLRSYGSKPAKLLLLLLLLLATMNNAAAKTKNRAIDQYAESGDYFHKKLIWRGIRTSPGSLWFGYFFYVVVGFASLCYVLRRRREARRAESEGPDAIIGLALDPEVIMDLHLYNALSAGLFYVSLAVNQLSDAMEAYLVALCSIQLAMDAQRCFQSSARSSWLKTVLTAMTSLLLAVQGIALLDSYRPLDKLNAAYFITSPLLLLLPPACKTFWTRVAQLVNRENMVGRMARRFSATSLTTMPLISSICHLVFLFMAFMLAEQVEGSHRQPMLAYLVTAFVYFCLINSIECMLPYPWNPPDPQQDQNPQQAQNEDSSRNAGSRLLGQTHSASRVRAFVYGFTVLVLCYS